MTKKYFLVISFIIILFGPFRLRAQEYYETAFKLGKVIEWIDKYYVDSVNKNTLVEGVIVDILQKLDPHSSYISSEEVKEMNEPLQGNFEGIGISFNILNDTIFVISPISGGPSEKVGLLAGDRIIKVDNKNVAGIGISNNDVFSLLRGNKGTRVNVSVMRRNASELIDFEIIRDKIPIFSIDASFKVKDDIGYIKLNRFSLTTMTEFNEALQKLRNQGVENLILDLTGNGGGYLEVAFELADEFLSNKKLIVYTEGINSPKREYVASEKGSFESGNLVVLIDEGSASASEIVSGAIQDWDRGLIMGRRSFGKGLVQRPLPLPDQSEIRLTVARYYTPTGRLIQKPYNDKMDYELDILNRYNHGELINKDSIHFPDSLKYQTLVKKRTVYGGGGIMPDYFIPIDTSYYSDFYRDLIRKSVLNQFILTYVDENRAKLQAEYPSFGSFNDKFIVDEQFFNRLVKYAETQGIKSDSKSIALSKEQIKLLVKAYISRDLWTNNEFFQVINQIDTKFIKAIEILENWNKYQAMMDNPN